MRETGTTTTTALVVIPCAAAKLDRPAPARDLYASANFAHTLRAAEAEATDHERMTGVPATVMILSAQHGLLDLDTIVAPYDTTMGDPGAVTADTVREQLAGHTTVTAMLPAAYYRVLAAAVAANNDDDTAPWIELLDVYEAAPGIGYQRGVATSLVRTAGTLPAAA